MQPAVREVSASALSFTARRRVARSAHCLRERSAEKGPLEQLQSSHNFTKRSSSRTYLVRGLSPTVGSAAVGSLRNGIRNATEAVMPLLGSGASLMAQQWKRTRAMSTLTCLAFGRQSQVYQALAQTALQRHVTGLSRSRRTGGLVISFDGQNLSNVQARLVLFWQRPPAQISQTCGSTSLGTGFTVKTYSSLLARFARTAAFQGIPPSPSHPASHFDRQAPLEHHV